MAITIETVNGSRLAENSPPHSCKQPIVRLRGKFGGNPSEFCLDESALSKHTLLVGGTGSGKTNLFYHIVDQLKNRLSQNDVMLIFDSKGDFLSKFRKPNDVVIGNSKQYRAASAKWSIYKEILADGSDRVSIAQNAQEICSSLFAEKAEKTSNAFFPNAARDLLAAIMIALHRSQIPFNNWDLRQYIDSSTPADIQELLKKHKDLAAVNAYIGAKAAGQTQGVISELNSTVREIFDGVFAEAGDFSIRNFVRKKGGRTLFLEYDLAIGDVLSPVYTLLFDLALKEALGRTSSQGNVYLIADELKLLPHLRHLEDGINFGRGLGVKILAGLQSIDQLNASYGEHAEAKARNIIAGFSSVYAFYSNDPVTREHISAMFGKNSTIEKYPLPNGQFQYTKQDGHVVEDWDLVSLDVGEAIVGLPSQKPFRFRFDLYTGGR